MRALVSLVAVAVAFVLVRGAASAQTDLDAFMRQVLAKRDDNWKKLQQYVLDEREQIELRGPSHAPLWGERREYTWYIRNGFFVRSPVKFNGAVISEADRRKYEADFLRRAQEREKRRGRGQAADGSGELARADEGSPPPVAESAEAPRDVDALLRQTREPEFISSAYFLRFKFEEGKYAFVGRETLAGREVLRIEYYPARLFTGTGRRRSGPSSSGASDQDKAYDAEFRRLMNKVSLVTLWVEPTAHQIAKYTFRNVALDFLPAQWLVHINDVQASMTMGQPFPDVWLPHDLEFTAAMTVALGQFDVRYGLEYHDYRRADVTTKVGVPKER